MRVRFSSSGNLQCFYRQIGTPAASLYRSDNCVSNAPGVLRSEKRNEEGEAERFIPATAYGRFFLAAETERLGNGARAEFMRGIPENMTLPIGNELNATILWSATEALDDDLNNTSIVMKLAFTENGRGASFLFTGDAEEAVESRLVQKFGDSLRSTVLKAGHHGSKSSSSKPFLNKVQPKHVVISSGTKKFSGVMLPRDETLQNIKDVSDSLQLDTKLWRTDRDDKSPRKKEGTEGGDDTVVAKTSGTTIAIGYAGELPTGPTLNPNLCQRITAKGSQCSRNPKSGIRFCWQHGS